MRYTIFSPRSSEYQKIAGFTIAFILMNPGVLSGMLLKRVKLTL